MRMLSKDSRPPTRWAHQQTICRSRRAPKSTCTQKATNITQQLWRYRSLPLPSDRQSRPRQIARAPATVTWTLSSSYRDPDPDQSNQIYRGRPKRSRFKIFHPLCPLPSALCPLPSALCRNHRLPQRTSTCLQFLHISRPLKIVKRVTTSLWLMRNPFCGPIQNT